MQTIFTPEMMEICNYLALLEPEDQRVFRAMIEAWCREKDLISGIGLTRSTDYEQRTVGQPKADRKTAKKERQTFLETKKIAAKLGKSVDTIHRLAKEHRIQKRPGSGNSFQYDFSAFLELQASGVV